MLRNLVGVLFVLLCMATGCGKKNAETQEGEAPDKSAPSLSAEVTVPTPGCIGKLSVNFTRLEEFFKPFDKYGAKDAVQMREVLGNRLEAYLMSDNEDSLHVVLRLPERRGNEKVLREALGEMFEFKDGTMALVPDDDEDVKYVAKLFSLNECYYRPTDAGLVIATRKDLLDHDFGKEKWHSGFIQQSRIADYGLALSLAIPKDPLWDRLFDRHFQKPGGYDDDDYALVARLLTVANVYDTTKALGVILHHSDGASKLTWLHQNRDVATAKTFEAERSNREGVDPKDRSITALLKKSVLKMTHSYDREESLHRLDFPIDEANEDELEDSLDLLTRSLEGKAFGLLKLNLQPRYPNPRYDKVRNGPVLRTKEEAVNYVKKILPTLISYAGREGKYFHYYRPSGKVVGQHFRDGVINLSADPIAVIGSDGKRKKYSGSRIIMSGGRSTTEHSPKKYDFPAGTEKVVFKVSFGAYLYGNHATLTKKSIGRWTDMQNVSAYMNQLEGPFYSLELTKKKKSIHEARNSSGDPLRLWVYTPYERDQFCIVRANDDIDSVDLYVANEYVRDMTFEAVLDCPKLRYYKTLPSNPVADVAERPQGFYKPIESLAVNCGKDDVTFDVQGAYFRRAGTTIKARTSYQLEWVRADGKKRSKTGRLDYWWGTGGSPRLLWVGKDWKSVKGTCTVNAIIKDRVETIIPKNGKAKQIFKTEDGQDVTVTVDGNVVSVQPKERAFRLYGLNDKGMMLACYGHLDLRRFRGVPKKVVVQIISKAEEWKYPIDMKK